MKIVYALGGVALTAIVYDQLARRGYVPKLFVKKTDNAVSSGASKPKPIGTVKPFGIKPGTPSGSGSSAK